MSKASRIFLGLGAAMLFLATAFGAYGSHAFAAQADAVTVSAFSTAVDYHFYHGLGLLAVSVFTELSPQNRVVRIAGALLVTGIVLFCGGIYATSLGAPQSIGVVTPLGGIAFLLGWAVLALAAWTSARSRATNPLA